MLNAGDTVLRRTWIFEAEVKGYYIPAKPLVIGDFELERIEDKEKGTRCIARLSVQAKGLDIAEKLAREEFDRIFEAIMLSARRRFEFEIKSATEITPDKQVARFTIYTGALKLLSEQFVGCAQEEPLRSLIEESWRQAAKTLGTAPWKLDEPIWTVGSKLCSERKCGQCPVEDLCDNTKGITFRENTVIWKRI